MKNPENAILVSQEDRFNDDLSLVDLVSFIQNNFRRLIVVTLIGGFLGLAIAFLLPEQWEARALVRVGRIGNVGNVGNVGNAGSPIEEPLLILERVKTQSFQNDVLKRLDLVAISSGAKPKISFGTIKAQLEKSELVKLTLKGGSQDVVKQQMNAVINELIDVHYKMSASTINYLQQELKSIDLALKNSNVESERLKKLLNKSNSLSERSLSQAVLISSLLLMREGELRNLRDSKRMLELQLRPERTFTTDIFEKIEVSTEPVFPKKTIFAVTGLFLGLLLGIMWCLLKSNRASGINSR